MNDIFDFQGLPQNESAIRATWSMFREALAKEEFTYDDIYSALGYTFLKTFDDTYKHMYAKINRPLSSFTSLTLLRGAKLKPTDTPEFSRFIPDAKYITEDNRFSPPGVEWLYLACGTNQAKALYCSKAECRTSSADRFGSCLFSIDEIHANDMVADLTIADRLSYAEINASLEKAGEKIRSKILQKSRLLGIPAPMTEFDKNKITAEIELWALRTYSKLLSEQIFTPLSTADDKHLMYSPFQCIAMYFMSKGLVGILYKSTVYDGGKNLVLFDKMFAHPFGKITIEEPLV